MSHLKVTTRTGAVVRKEFLDQFKDIADSVIHDMRVIDTKAINCNDNIDIIAEGRDIEHMATFMLDTGTVLGIKWGDKFYFGDVDLMDMHDGWETESTILQYCIEDEPILKDIFKMFEKINDDCMRAGEDAVPLDAKEYYSEQIQNVYEISEEQADILAEQMRKFIIFQQSGRDVPDTSKYTGEDNGVQPGRVYLADPEDKCGLVIDDSSGWFHQDNNPEHWHLLVANQEWMSNELSDLEFELFDFAMSAGWTDDL